MRPNRNRLATLIEGLPRAAAAALLALVAGCASLPPLEGRVASSAIADTGSTRLGASVAPLAAAHPGLSGIHALPLATDAFAARMLLAGAAEKSIDAQYYIWRADQTGLLLLDALWQAARRGARVRLLLDDANTSGMDETLAALAAQPNVEVRLYNPFAHRSARLVDFAVDFARVNRRMHNKAFIADGAAAVIGGRNVGNEYFGAGHEIPFKDLDVVAIGPAVREASAAFDLYWNSASAYPVSLLVPPAPPTAAATLEQAFGAARSDPASQAYVEAVRATPLVARLLERSLPLEWAVARVLRDDPSKTRGEDAGTEALLLNALLAGTERPRASFDLISPYFVPGERGTQALEALARSGVRVRVLTNSLAATDVGVVHSGYAKRRCRLARAGVRLYELKPAFTPVADSRPGGSSGSAAARLHAKAFAADGERVFVGSFNFDPRSALLNTEMGLLMASPALATRLSAAFDGVVPMSAYEVRPVEGEACVEWIERTAAGETRHATEPGTGAGRRAWVQFLTLLPLDWML